MPKYDVGEIITALNEAVNKLNNLHAKCDNLEKERDALQADNAVMLAALRRINSSITPPEEIELQAENEKLREALRLAFDAVEHWASYASPYFQEKHDLAGDLQKLRAALGENK